MSSSESELPPLRRSTPKRRTTGKRSRDSDSDNSSDGIFFSSDDLADSSAKNYVSPARRAQYRRAWYEPEEPSRVHTHEAMRTATRRPKDSGIYMNSDDSSSSVDDGFAVDNLKLAATQRASKKMAAFMASPSPSQPKEEEHLVRTAVAHCLEHGKETLDLTGKELSTIRDEDLQPLRNHVRHPRFDPTAFTEESLQALVPSLQIFLSNNRLRRVPNEIFNITSLTCLSLRNNLVNEIPPAIGRLESLQELNLAGNQLKWLPWELIPSLMLGNLVTLHERPNPLLPCTIDFQPEASRPPIAMDSIKLSDMITFLGASAAAFFEHDGRVSQWSPLPPSLFKGESLPIYSDPFERFRGTDLRATPSLFEAALRSCMQSPDLNSLQSYMPKDTPDHIKCAIQLAQDVTAQGGRQCSICGNQFVIARAEWIEFWYTRRNPTHLDTQVASRMDGLTTPFLRRVCSWRCALRAKVSTSAAKH